jgi:hypothetical protein
MGFDPNGTREIKERGLPTARENDGSVGNKNLDPHTVYQHADPEGIPDTPNPLLLDLHEVSSWNTVEGI